MIKTFATYVPERGGKVQKIEADFPENRVDVRSPHFHRFVLPTLYECEPNACKTSESTFRLPGGPEKAAKAPS